MIATATRNWLLLCPLLKPETLVLVDQIGAEPTQYEIAALPAEPIVRQYVDGGSLRQFVFAIASREAYNGNQNIDNAEFYDRLQQWIDEQSKKRNLPKLGAGRMPQKVSVLTSGYVFSAEDSTAIYQMECRLLYTSY